MCGLLLSFNNLSTKIGYPTVNNNLNKDFFFKQSNVIDKKCLSYWCLKLSSHYSTLSLMSCVHEIITQQSDQPDSFLFSVLNSCTAVNIT